MGWLAGDKPPLETLLGGLNRRLKSATSERRWFAPQAATCEAKAWAKAAAIEINGLGDFSPKVVAAFHRSGCDCIKARFFLFNLIFNELS